ELRIDRAQDRVLGHDHFIGRERDERSAGHGIMRYENRNLAFALENSARNLRGRQDQAAGRMEDEVERNLWIGQMNRTNQVFAIVDIDVTEDRKPEETHRFLAMNKQNHARFPVALD